MWFLLWSAVLALSLVVSARNGVAETTAKNRPDGKYYTDLLDYGISGVGNRSADQATALASAIAATPNGGEILCRAGTVMHVSRINIVHRLGLRFRAAATGYGNGGQCQIYYIGTDDGTLLNLDSDYDIVFDGWSFHGHDNNSRAVGAKYVVNINKVTSCTSGGLNSSHNSFFNGLIETGTTKPDAIAVAMGIDSCAQNSEFMHFENMQITGYKSGDRRYGTGFYLHHSNVKGITLNRLSVGPLHILMNAGNGSFKAHETRGGDTDIYWQGAGFENALVVGDNFEQGCQVLNGVGGGYWRFMGGRYQAWDAGCGNSRNPLFQVVGGTLELDYPTLDGNLVTGTNFYVKDTTGQSQLILHGVQGDFGAANGISTFRIATLVTSDEGLVEGGNLNAPLGFEPGYHFFDSGGNLLRGWHIKGGNSAAPCTTGNRCFGEGELELTGVAPAVFPTTSITGTPGSQQLVLRVYPKDGSGNRALSFYAASISNAPNSMNRSNHVTVSLAVAPAGVASYDVVHRCNDGSYALVASGVKLPHKITANPVCPGKYTPPALNESAGLKLRAPQGIDVTGGMTLTGTVTTPRITGITDNGVVKNLNADAVDGHHASDFATAIHTHTGGDITSGTVPDSAKWAGKMAIDFSRTLHFASIAASSCVEMSLSLPGVAAGDSIAPAWPLTLDPAVLGMMFVSGPDTVKVRLCNLSGSSINVASRVFGGRVIR